MKRLFRFTALVLAGVLFLNTVTASAVEGGASLPISQSQEDDSATDPAADPATDPAADSATDPVADPDASLGGDLVEVQSNSGEFSASEEQSTASGDAMTASEDPLQQTFEQTQEDTALASYVDGTRDKTLTWYGEMTGDATKVTENQINLNSGEDLIFLSYVNPLEYQNKTLYIVANESVGFDVTQSITIGEGESAVDYTFQGLGGDDESGAFSGSFRLADGSSAVPLQLNRALFRTLSTQAGISDLNLQFIGTPGALLAENVVCDEQLTNASWALIIGKMVSDEDLILAPILGRMGSSGSVRLSVILNATANFMGSGDMGLLCGSMGTNATLSLGKLVGTMPSITSTSGNAGGLVGSMAEGASLVIEEGVSVSPSNVTAESGSAGGLIGSADNIGNLSKLPGIVVPENASLVIRGKNAGGCIGELSYGTESDTGELRLTQYVQGVQLIGSANAGGLFGVLHYRGKGIVTISPKEEVSVTFGSEAGGNAGGLMGAYQAEFPSGTLRIPQGKVSSVVLGASQDNYGGIIGQVKGDSTERFAYLEFGVEQDPSAGEGEAALGVTVDIKGNAKGYFGGLVGDLYTKKGHFVRAGRITVTGRDVKGNSGLGGLVGGMDGGALWLCGEINLTGFTPQNDPKGVRGWILGNHGNTLVYNTYDYNGAEPGLSWSFQKGNQTNDIGNWGQVIQITENLTDLLTFDESAHTLTVCPATKTDDTYVVSSVKEFAALALRIQLASQGALIFDHSIAKNSSVNISISSSLDLTGSGFTGFQRDSQSADYISIAISGSQPGITLTLPEDIFVYTVDKAHDRQGLFSRLADLTAEQITLNGGIKISVLANSVQAGGLAANVTGNVFLKEVTGAVDVTANEMSDPNTVNGNVADSKLAGLIAFVQGGDSVSKTVAIALEQCRWESTVTDGSRGNSFVGGFLGRTEKSVAITVKDCTIDQGKIIKGSNGERGYAAVGGLVASVMERGNSGTTPESSLTVNGLTIDGETITLGQSAGKNQINTCGGLLGYEWIGVNATIQGVLITNSSLDAKQAEFGGLVYKGSGYWQVEKNKNNDTPGVWISSGNSFAGGSDDNHPSGLFLSRGDKQTDHNNALYLEIHEGAYLISSDTEVTLSAGSYFDEIVGTTINSGTDGTFNNGIVSIAVTDGEGSARIDQSEQDCNTYRQQITGENVPLWKNPHTRYYYNLDTFLEDTIPDTIIDSPDKMVLWSASQHCYSGLKAYFAKGASFRIRGKIDLTGYSYYPVVYRDTISIEGATIVFDYKTMDKAEDGAKNKRPSDSDCQHAGMHAGIFSVVAGGITDFSVSELTLQGTVGSYHGKYGALICDRAEGKDTNTVLQMNLSGVTLDNIRVYLHGENEWVTDAVNAPLLIHAIGSYTTLNLSGVETTDNTVYKNLEEGQYAAGSLIGQVGGPQGTTLQLIFGDMKLDGRTEKGTECVHNTYRTIFSRALFLEEFCYSEASTCRGIYNFAKPEDDKKPYTLGQELSNTANGAVGGRNNGQQYYFLGSTEKVCSTLGSVDEAGCFVAYRRYVAKKEGVVLSESVGDLTVTRVNHELDINLTQRGLTEGCGTYSHPYVITSGLQLQALAQTISSGGISEGWEINLDQNVLGNTFADQNGHTENSSAEDTRCMKYVGTSNGWRKDGESSNDRKATKDNVLRYLLNAYYVIDGWNGPIMLEGTWAGLGGNDVNTAFSGVMIGKNNAEIQIREVNPETQFGGLIKFSQGSVIKDLTVTYTNAPAVNAGTDTNTALSGNANQAFFGGVVGWCLGGDTILDKVEVAFSDSPTINGTTNLHLIAAGGYVGVVGGYYENGNERQGGGVVFRNITSNSGKLSSVNVGGTNAPVSAEAEVSDTAKNYFYVNPYVGRVLDGYVLSEGTHRLNNTDKNYQIPCISQDKHLKIKGSVVSVLDAEGLWLLSAITNSGSGNLRSEDNYAYVYGKPRTCAYDQVGKKISVSEESGKELKDEQFLGGKKNTGKTNAYLFQYTEGDFSNFLASDITILLTSDCDMSSYGNGFRGIGASYGTYYMTNNDNNAKLTSHKNDRSIKLAGLQGDGHTITLAQNRRENLEEDASWRPIGAGLFVELGVPGSKNVSVNEVKLRGYTGISYYTDGQSANTDGSEVSGILYKDYRHGCVGVGMLAGSLCIADANNEYNITLSKVELVGTKTSPVLVNGDGDVVSTFAGGLIGLVWVNANKKDTLVLEDCKYSNIQVTGRVDAGGLLGYVKASEVLITYTGETELTNAVIRSTETGCMNLNSDKRDGIGGLIGYLDYGRMDINKEGKKLTFRDLHLTSATNNSENNVGGLVGTWRVENINASNTIRNIAMEGDIELKNNGSTVKTNIGLLAGFISDSALNNWNGGNNALDVKVSNIDIAQEKDTHVILSSGWQIGGLIGLYKSQSRIENGVLKGVLCLDNIRMGSNQSTLTLINGLGTSDNKATIAGLLGTVGLYPSIKASNIHMTNMTVIGYGSVSALFARFDHQKTNTNDLSNISITNCTLATCGSTVDNNDRSAGLGVIFGWFNGKENVTISGHNLLVEDCRMGYLAKDSSSGTKGNMPSLDSLTDLSSLYIGLCDNSSTCYTYEKLLAQEDYLNTYTIGNVGILGGRISSPNTLCVQLVGISIQQTENTLPMKYFVKDIKEESYVIRADYGGARMGSVIPEGDEPYVTTKPISSLGALPASNQSDYFTVTGDGAYGVGAENMAGKIVSDYMNEALKRRNLQYCNVEEALKLYAKDSGIYNGLITDFYGAGDNIWESTKPDNFPVLLLETTDNSEINRILYSYISLLTNQPEYTGTGAALTAQAHDYYILSATTYEWNGAGFVPAIKNSLNVKDKRFTLASGCYDNQKKQFTLIDVAYTDPVDRSRIVYHLYIPVLVKKVLEFKFWAATQVGTTYNEAAYGSLVDLAIGSHGERITALIGYEYQRSAAEWQDAVDGGDNLLWNFKKQIVLYKNSNTSLPTGTRMSLVDCYDQKVYQTKIVENTLTEDSIMDFATVFGSEFSANPLCDLLKLEAVEDTGGSYVHVNQEDPEATIRVGKDYYRPVKAEETEVTLYTITVNLEETEKVTERYYLTIETPENTAEVINLDIQCTDRLVNPEKGGLPTQIVAHGSNRKYCRNKSENKIIIGNFFEQIVTAIVESRSELIEPTDSTILASLSSKITFGKDTEGNSYAQLFQDYAKGQRIYQAFDLILDKQIQGVGERSIAAGTVISVDYLKNGVPVGQTQTYVVGEQVNAYSLVFPGEPGENGAMIPGIAVSSLGEEGVTLQAKVELSYADDVIMEQFPVRASEDSRDGVLVTGSSRLAYSEEALKRTGITSMADTRDNTLRFYRKDFLTASLYYCAYENWTGDPTEGISRLGVNGLEDGSYFDIQTAGTYHVGTLPHLEEAKELRCNIELWQKQEDGTYIKVDRDQYLPWLEVSVRLTGEDGNTVESEKQCLSTTGVLSASFNVSGGFDSEIPIQISVNLQVLTGQEFEENNFIYSNYKVVLTAELLKENGEVLAGSSVSDYIIYTNARIVRELVL